MDVHLVKTIKNLANKDGALQNVWQVSTNMDAAFQKRCEELHDGLFEKLQGQNIGSFSTLAFALGSPQNPVSDDEFTKLADAVFETQSTLGTTALLRRLHFESCTLLIAEMKTQSACADASEPIRKLPFIEKQSRLDAQKKRLPKMQKVWNPLASQTRQTMEKQTQQKETRQKRRHANLPARFAFRQQRKQRNNTRKGPEPQQTKSHTNPWGLPPTR